MKAKTKNYNSEFKKLVKKIKTGQSEGKYSHNLNPEKTAELWLRFKGITPEKQNAVLMVLGGKN